MLFCMLIKFRLLYNFADVVTGFKSLDEQAGSSVNIDCSGGFMKRFPVKGVGCIIALAMLSASIALYAASKDEAVSMVKKVEAFYKKNGRVKMAEAVQKDKGQFEKGELYVYIIDFKGIVIAHPRLPGWVGKSYLNLKDADGKYFIKDAVEQLKVKNECWVEYKWNNPETKKTGLKISYFLKVDDFIISCGVWK